MKAKVWRVDPSEPDAKSIEEAASILRKGGVVAFPTETVYGLGAVYHMRDAVIRVFKVKRRPPDNPLILHISSFSQIYTLASEVPEAVHRLAEKFWPGPLTVVLPKTSRVPYEVTGGLEKVAVRMPAHNVALRLIEAVGDPIAAPSANLSGRPSPTTAQHVLADLGDEIDGVLDAGETLYGVESTVIDLTADPPVLLRPGAVPLEEVEKVLGKVCVPAFARGLGEAERALAPGTRYRHYSPRAQLVLVELKDYSDLSKLVDRVKRLVAENAGRGLRVGVLCTDETREHYSGLGAVVLSLGSRRDPFGIARRLYSSFREMDSLGVDVIVAEGVDERGLGLTIMNRMRKASTKRVVV
ncbi:L-threonylcarbamoyladenylate synthase [Thermofilum pendens]|uniref:L-threonylcarbamoyladenylate synthase n=1 Tax=Thermofilum pendens TaxID=2269 RepID=UPI0011E57D73|nr:L-threonylcarbamoyladenylate synthase [Thermofilum pendens]